MEPAAAPAPVSDEGSTDTSAGLRVRWSGNGASPSGRLLYGSLVFTPVRGSR